MTEEEAQGTTRCSSTAGRVPLLQSGCWSPPKTLPAAWQTTHRVKPWMALQTPPACLGPIPGSLFHTFFSISSSLFVSSAPASHALIHADLQGSLSAAELPPGASPSALLRLLLFKFSLKQWQTLSRKHSTPGREPIHLCTGFLMQALSPQPPRSCRGGNSDTALACIAPSKEYQTGMKHKTHLGKKKSSRHIARRGEMGTPPA